MPPSSPTKCQKTSIVSCSQAVDQRQIQWRLSWPDKAQEIIQSLHYKMVIMAMLAHSTWPASVLGTIIFQEPKELSQHASLICIEVHGQELKLENSMLNRLRILLTSTHRVRLPCLWLSQSRASVASIQCHVALSIKQPSMSVMLVAFIWVTRCKQDSVDLVAIIGASSTLEHSPTLFQWPRPSEMAFHLQPLHAQRKLQTVWTKLLSPLTQRTH